MNNLETMVTMATKDKKKKKNTSQHRKPKIRATQTPTKIRN